MELTSANVDAVTKDCLYTDDELPPAVTEDNLPDGAVLVEGVIHKYVFNPVRLEGHRDDVRSMIGELPRQFFKEGGGGWSFLNLCMTQKAIDAGRDGDIWTGLHLVQEQLYCLAAGLGMAQIFPQRDLWSIMPGSVPYMIFSLDGFDDEKKVNTELFVDSAGTHVEVHERNDDCMENGCCIHNPSDHPLRDAPLVWRIVGPFDIKPPHMERFCEHGVGHPDPDSLAFMRRTGKEELADSLAVHGCDGCCTRSTTVA